MGSISYSAHISNGKSAITSKSKLQGVAMHNLRKYKSGDYSSEYILLLQGSENLYQDVRNIYQREFDDAVREYNEKQKRVKRRIDDYFEHVAKLDQDMAVEIIFQCGDKKFWDDHAESKERMYHVYRYVLSKLQEYLPNYKIANAVIHFDEASPHMHVVGVPVWSETKKGLSKKVSKRNVFTPTTLSVVLQDKLRDEARDCFRFNIHETIGDKKIGRNYDLSVMEYKIARETENLQKISTDKKETESKITMLEWRKVHLEDEIKDIEDEIQKFNLFLDAIDQIKRFILSYLPFAPLIEEFANTVEQSNDIVAGNSFRGVFSSLGELLNSFKEKILDGVCWFPRLMRWTTSMGEVSPVFRDLKNEGYNYQLSSYANVVTNDEYSIERIQPEIKSENRIGTLEQLLENIEVVERQASRLKIQKHKEFVK